MDTSMCSLSMEPILGAGNKPHQAPAASGDSSSNRGDGRKVF